tara:strand:+ start:6975 stop:7340 length:366 start_codon:yes stop_codon:yes gene_type:complete
MAYHDPIYTTHTLKAQSIATAATMLSVVGPRGKVGRLESVSAVVTTGTTDAATELRVGTAADADKFGTLSVPVATAGNGYNNATIANIDTNPMPANDVVLIATDGGCTAGAADISVTIAWY